ncbi:hypothetical protein SHA04_18300 [Staphylococcus haemolyticus]|nr:hypothetical protein SHA04_18300 [Staphylococcus haemolyticus]
MRPPTNALMNRLITTFSLHKHKTIINNTAITTALNITTHPLSLYRTKVFNMFLIIPSSWYVVNVELHSKLIRLFILNKE